MNSTIPLKLCFSCKILTNETWSIHKIGHKDCFTNAQVPKFEEQKANKAFNKYLGNNYGNSNT